MQIIRRARQDTRKAGLACEEGLREIYRQEQIVPDGGRNPGEDSFGLAVDIGTTTVAVALYQLNTGKYIGSTQGRNRQTVLGRDVMMRLMHCQRGHQGRLQRMIIEQLEQMAAEVTDNACRLCDVRKMTVVGNTSMCHIFAGQDISGLAGSPFSTSYHGAFHCNGGDLGFKELVQTEIYILAGVDAHVGADAVSMVAVLDMVHREGVQLAIDIGTNAEIALKDSRGGLLTCSVPAGPAFEGMEISCGMSGGPGAIAGVRFAPQAGNVILEVIDRGPDDGSRLPVPAGICGSGLIDVVAQFLQYRLLTKDGYLLSAQEAAQAGVPGYLACRLIEWDGERGFLLYEPEGAGDAVIVSQQDIRQFQLAKAAVQAGITVLLSSRGICLEQVEQIWIAGVFGGHISKGSAVKTGLFPDVPPDKLLVVGNAAAEGAAHALVSREFRKASEKIAEEAQHLELASSEIFQKEYIEAMEFCN